MRTRHENEKQHDNASIRVVSTLSYHITNSNALPSPSLAPLTVTADLTVVVSTVLARRQTRQLRLAAHCTHCTVTRLHPSPLPTTSSPPPYSPLPLSSLPLAPHALSDAVINVLVIFCDFKCFLCFVFVFISSNMHGQMIIQ